MSKSTKATDQTSKLCPKLRAQSCQFFYGIDVSKDNFVSAKIMENGKYKVEKISNTEDEIKVFLDSIEHREKTLVTLEATGTYSMKLIFALCEAGIPTAVLNPKQSKGFISGVLLSTTKTDNKDACGLALYGQINRPATYTIPEDSILELRQLRNLLAMYKKRKAASMNLLHALSFHARPSEFVVTTLEQEIETLTQKIKKVEEQLCNLSQQNFDQLYKLSLSIKGIGPATATALLMVTNGCQGFQNAKQLAKFLGVCPTQNESGSSVKGRGSLAKTGTKEVRTLLYMGARSAKRYNPACKDLYERLRRKGKCHKVAMNAVCHKMVKQYFAVIKSGKPFDEQVYFQSLQKQEKSINS